MVSVHNHYRFSIYPGQDLFNTVHVLYFLSEYMVNSQIPYNLIDRNAMMDYMKLRHLIIIDKKGIPMVNGNFYQLQQILETGQAITHIKPGFPADELTKPGNFLSLLYYFGLLTISNTTPTGENSRGQANCSFPVYCYLLPMISRHAIMRAGEKR